MTSTPEAEAWESEFAAILVYRVNFKSASDSQLGPASEHVNPKPHVFSKCWCQQLKEVNGSEARWCWCPHTRWHWASCWCARGWPSLGLVSGKVMSTVQRCVCCRDSHVLISSFLEMWFSSKALGIVVVVCSQLSTLDQSAFSLLFLNICLYPL